MTILALLCMIGILGSTPRSARADTFTATYLAPTVQTPSVITTYENFNGAFTGTTTFNGSGIIGTYSGDYAILSADEYGGAGGTGSFISTTTPGGTPGSYTLTLNKQVDYFGLWFSALDSGNDLYFYNGSTLVYSFLPADYATLVGPCPGPYCGNPNAAFLGQDSSQQYAYLNFLDTTGTFNKIVFTEDPAVGQFESDNQAVAAGIKSIPGTPVGSMATPEPSSLMLLGTGILGIAGVVRRRLVR